MSVAFAASPSHFDPDGNDALGFAILLSTAFYGLLILGISFNFEPTQPHQPQRTLDVTVVRPTPDPKPAEDPQFLAQTSQEGGAETLSEEKQRPTAPPSPPAIEPRPKPARETEKSGVPKPTPKQAPRIITQRKAVKVAPVAKPKPQIQARPTPDLSQLLANTQQEIDRLTAEIDQQSRNYASRERKKSINASTQEYKYAAYMEAWRKKIERIGTLNFPIEAKEKRIYGNLILSVDVKADGSVEKIRIVRSSGHKILDQAAIDIVKLAAPFAPFPSNIREEVDILNINRTWQFLSNNRLFTEN